MHTLVIICVGIAVALWVFIGLLFIGVTIYNKVGGKHLSFKKADLKVQDNATNNKDKSDLFL